MQQCKEQENCGDGVASKKEKCTVDVTTTDCNYHVTPFCKKLYGSLDYYYDEKKNPENKEKNKGDKEKKEKKEKNEEDKEKNRECSGFLSRHFDFLDRHQCCNHQVPKYYKDYGYKYVNILTHQLGEIVSDKGKDWIKNARYLLQDYMEDGFENNITESTFHVRSESSKYVYYDVKDVALERLELDNEIFKKFAFDTHPLAYIDGGLHDISIGDKIFLLVLLHDELLDPTTQDQMGTIAVQGAKDETFKYVDDITALLLSAPILLRPVLNTTTKIKPKGSINKVKGTIDENVNIDDTKITIDGEVLFAIYTKEELQELHCLREIIDNVTFDMKKADYGMPIAYVIKVILYTAMKLMDLLGINGKDLVSGIKAGVKGIKIVITSVKVTIMFPYNVADHVHDGFWTIVDASINGDGSIVSNAIEAYGDAITDIWNYLFK